MSQIAAVLNVRYPKVVYWLKKYCIPRRSRSESAYLKHNLGKDPFKIKKRLNKQDRELFISGLLLFWAEGNKATKGSIQLANLDYRMLQLFIKFLRKICKIKENKLRLYVRIFNKFNKAKAKKYWFKILRMPIENIYIYNHTDRRSRISKQWSKYGIATLQVYNTKLRNWLDEELDEFISSTMKE